MDQFIDACISRFRTVLMIFILLLVVGAYSYATIPKEEAPDIQIPIIYVSVVHQGISPEDAERMIIKPLERELKSIEGIKEIRSVASLGHASVTLEFYAGFNSNKALNDVREKVDIGKAELPEDSEEPVIREVNLSLFPIINIILTGDLPERTLINTARRLEDELETIPNVLDVTIAGEKEDTVEIIIHPKTLEAYGIRAEDIASVSGNYNKLVTAGTLRSETGSFQVKVPGLLENLQDILSLPLVETNASVITVGDVATIKKTYRDPENMARVNNKPSVVLEVSKRTGTNMIETIEQVKALMNIAQQSFPEHLQVIYAQDTSSNIMDMLRDLENNIILATILVLIVTLLAIGFSGSTLISTAIPGAFLIGIVFLQSMNMTVNIVVLFSLILSIGMLVDSAIIVCELANRKRFEGLSAKEAYSDAAKYMKWPIITSTATTLVVFMPLLFWPGIVGQFMQYMPITLIATLTGSMLMAIIFIPTFGAIFSRKRSSATSLNSDFITISENGDLSTLRGIAGFYYRILTWVLTFPKSFVGIIIIALTCIIIGFTTFGAGTEFFPKVEPNNAIIYVQSRGNLSLEEKDKLTKHVEQRIISKLSDEIRVFYTRIGKSNDNGGNQAPRDTIASIQVEFTHWTKRRKASEILNTVRSLTSDIPGIIVSISEEQSGPTQAKPIEVQVLSNDPENQYRYFNSLYAYIRSLDGLIDTETNLPTPAIEWQMDVDRIQASRFGANISNIGAFIQLVTNGLKASSYRPDDNDDEVDILARFPEQYRHLSRLDFITINTLSGPVPISHFVTRQAKPTTDIIERVNGYRMLTVRSDVLENVNPNDKVNLIKTWLSDNPPPANIFIKFKGDDEEQQQTASFLGNAFLLALFCMALILVTQFNSVFAMLIILSAVFLSSGGVFLGLLITHQAFGIVMCGVGLISLSGIVVNNNIVFIDTFIKLLEQGQPVREAICRTGVQRLRPILLTSGTTVLGLIPMVFALNIDFITLDFTIGAPSSQWWQQLSVTIAGGLAFATILTLLFTPALLLLGYKRKQPS